MHPQKLLNVIFVPGGHEGHSAVRRFILDCPHLHQQRNEARLCPGPHPLGHLLSLLQSFSFSASKGGVFLLTRSDGKLLNLSRLRAKSISSCFEKCSLLTTLLDKQEGIQRLINRLAHGLAERIWPYHKLT